MNSTDTTESKNTPTPEKQVFVPTPIKTKDQQYNEYLNNGGTMSKKEWENDGRYDKTHIAEKAERLEPVQYHGGPCATMDVSENGRYVSIEDYSRLKQENEALRLSHKMLNGLNKSLVEALEKIDEEIPNPKLPVTVAIKEIVKSALTKAKGQ